MGRLNINRVVNEIKRVTRLASYILLLIRLYTLKQINASLMMLLFNVLSFSHFLRPLTRTIDSTYDLRV